MWYTVRYVLCSDLLEEGIYYLRDRKSLLLHNKLVAPSGILNTRIRLVWDVSHVRVITEEGCSLCSTFWKGATGDTKRLLCCCIA